MEVLSIVADLNGEPEVAWLKDNKPVNQNDRIQFKQDGITHSLLVANVTANDEGIYTLTAQNEKGVTRANSEVVVASKRGDKPKTGVKIVKKDEAPGAPEEAAVGCLNRRAQRRRGT